MLSFGEKLKQERESRDTPIEEIASTTKIQVSYLKALERNEFEALPGGAFGKFYIRAYAEVLGFDPQPLIADYDRERHGRKQEEPPEEKQEELPKEVEVEVEAEVEAVLSRLEVTHYTGKPASSSRWSAVTLTLLLVGLPILMVWIYVAFRTDDAGVESPSVASPQLSAEISKPSASTPPSPSGEKQPALEKKTTGSSLPAGTATGAGSLSVPEFGVGRQVVNRRLEGRGDRFQKGRVAWFSTRVLGGEAGEYIRHVWLHEGKTVQSIELKLGGPHWRTHSRKTLWSLGEWTVEARDPEDRVLARATFTCVPGGS